MVGLVAVREGAKGLDLALGLAGALVAGVGWVVEVDRQTFPVVTGSALDQQETVGVAAVAAVDEAIARVLGVEWVATEVIAMSAETLAAGLHKGWDRTQVTTGRCLQRSPLWRHHRHR